MRKQHYLTVYKYNFYKLMTSISTIVFLTLIGVASLVMSISFLITPGFSNGFTGVGLSNYYLIWMVIVIPINLVFIFLKASQLFRDEIDDGTMLIMVTKSINRVSIYWQKILSLFLMALIFIGCQAVFPFIFGFIQYKVYTFNSATLAVARWGSMQLTLIVINMILIGLAVFFNQFCSGKIIITIAALLALLSIPGSLSDMILQTSSDKTQMFINNEQSVLQETYELQQNYYQKNQYIEGILEQGIKAKSLTAFYQGELTTMFAPCGQVVESHGVIDNDLSFATNSQSVTPILNQLTDKSQKDFILLFWNLNQKFQCPMTNHQHNQVLSLWETITQKLNNYLNLSLPETQTLPQGLSINEYVAKFNSYNNILIYNSWFNPIKQWTLMSGELSFGKNQLKEFQGFPASEYVAHYTLDANQHYVLNWSKVQNLNHPVIFNLVWIIIGLIIWGLAGVWFCKRDIN